MILTCPSCTMRYLIAEGAIGPSGRKVRCAHCGHKWFQDGEDGLDTALFDAREDVGAAAPEAAGSDDFRSMLKKESSRAPLDIPEGVRPIKEHEPLTIPPTQKFSVKLPAAPEGRSAGFLTAAAVFILLLCGVLLMHQPISRAWPPSNLLFGMLGLAPALPGDGLTIDALEAIVRDGKMLLTGDINNLTATDKDVPYMMVVFLDADEKPLQEVLLAPPVGNLKAEGTVPFELIYFSLPQDTARLSVSFSHIQPEDAAADISAPALPPAPAPGTPAGN